MGIRFLAYKPQNYENIKSHPLLIFLHGLGEKGDNLSLVKRNGPPHLIENGSWDKTLPFIVVSPQLPSNLGSWGPGVVDEVIDYVISKYKVDESRIYITGLSLGGHGTWNYALKYPDRVAAIVPVCGRGVPSNACNMKDVPVWAFHNEGDGTVHVSGTINMIDALLKCPASTAPKKVIYPVGGHNAWTKTYDLSAGHDIYSWMLSYTNKRSTNPPNKAPIVNAGGNKTLTLPNNSITLNGSASDSDGTVTAYQWEKTSGPSVTMANVNNSTLKLTNLIEGSYTFKLTVTDNKGATATAQAKVTVNPEPEPENQAPIADAGGDKLLTLPHNSTILNGKGSDSDGSVVSYNWSKVSGPEATMDGTNKADLTLANLLEGTYTFKLTVTDNKGATASAQAKVTVNPKPEPENQAPVANAGGDKTLTLPENSITLNGSGEDGDGSIASYYWSKVSGPEATVGETNKAGLELNNLLEGTYIFKLTVTDNKGATASAQAKVTVNPKPEPENQAPVANAGGNKTLTLPENSITLNGSGEDGDGSITSYNWSKVSGPEATVGETNMADLELSNLLEGIYFFELTVTDNKGATASAQAKVTVNPAPEPKNEAPVANAGGSKTLILPENSIILNGSGTDSDGTITAYRWTKVSGPDAEIADMDKADLKLSNLLGGTYIFQLTVTDNKGATTSDQAKVTVSPESEAENQVPVANAGEDRILTLPENAITLNGSGEDSDGSITAYQWTKVSGPDAAMEDIGKADLKLSNLLRGTYTFQLTVTDDKGATASDHVKITVNPKPNQAPVANAGEDKTLTLPQNAITLNGSGEDNDGSITAYLWTKVSGADVTMTDIDKANLKLSKLLEGTYVFELTVTDNKGAKATAQARVTVNPKPNQAPIANAGNDKTLTLPKNTLILNGSGEDKDGSITAYQWTKVSGPDVTMTYADKADLNLSGLEEGTYLFEITVTDNKGAKASAQAKVRVNPAPNQPPVANAGKDRLLHLPNNSIKLLGTGTDVDGTITGYQWSKIAGPSVSIADAYTTTLSLSDLVAGVYIFKLTVTDNKGAKASDEVKITVNSPPLANAGRDKIITLPTNATYLSGAGSDKDGTIVAYAWTKKSGSAVVMENADTYLLLLSELQEGTHTFTLEVTDNRGATATDEVKVTVLPAENILPTVDAGRDKKIQLPANSLRLIGSASDPDGTIVSYQWTKTAGPSASMAGGDEPVLQLSNLVEGSYTFRLTVKDNTGAAAFDEVNVVVERIIVDMFLTFATAYNNCFGVNEGSAEVSVTGGEAPYSYYWSNGASSNSIDGLGAGSYTVTVTDRYGASKKGTVHIAQPEELKVDVKIANETNRGNDGRINVSITGGTAPYTYEWSNGGSNSDNENLPRGEYTLVVYDANGCSATQSYQVDKVKEYSTSIYPNPSNGRFSLSFDNLEASRYKLRIYDAHGLLIFEKDNDITSALQTEALDLSDKGKGIYFIKIVYDGEYEETKRVIVH